MSGAVFLSYASEDAEAARRICDALRAGGVEVWFDQSELRGGDTWDQKIRQQIRECALFVAVISAATQGRREGYFRREWKAAVERTHDMADGTPFLVPVVIDETRERAALVPEVFLQVQWSKLPGGVTPAGFVERVRVLLRTEAELPPTSLGAPSSRPVPLGRPAGSVRRWVGAALVLAAGAGLGLYLFRSRAALPAGGAGRSDAAQPPALAGTGLKASPANRALQLIDQLECTQSEAQAAEDLCRAQLAQLPTDAAAAVALARVESYFLLRGFDRSEARFATAKASAERALALAPEDPNAQEGMGTYLYTRQIELPRAAALLRKAIAASPPNPRLARMLDNVLFVDPTVPEADALASATATGNRFPQDALVQYEIFRHFRDAGRLPETFHYLDLAIKLGPVPNAIIAKARLGLVLRGDVAGMRALLDQVPERSRETDRTMFTEFIYACASRQYALGLAALRSMPETWLQDFDYAGPKALLEGELYLLQQRPELARRSFEAAWSEFHQHGETATLNFSSNWVEVWLLNRLGRVEEARARNAENIAEYPHPYRLYLGTNWWFNPIVVNLLMGRRDVAVNLMHESVGFQYGRTIIARMLELDPRLAPWRQDPDIAAVLAESDAGAAAPSAFPSAPPSRNWPHDPQLRHAIALIEGPEAVVDDFTFADEIARRAVVQAPTDPEAATVLARVENEFLLRGFDVTEARAMSAKQAAARALELAPDEPEALFAEAIFLMSRSDESAPAEKLLQRACTLVPDQPRYWRALAEARFIQHPAEGLAISRQNAVRFPRDALVHYDTSRFDRSVGLYEDMEREIDASIALNPIPFALLWKGRIAFCLHGDLPAMKTWLDRMPGRTRTAERAVYSMFIWSAVSGDAAAGLDALNLYPEAWFANPNEYMGPSSLLRASLLDLQGKHALAQLQAQAALTEVRRRVELDPTNVNLRIAETWALIGLGRLDEARTVNRIRLESIVHPFRITPFTSWWFEPIPLNLLLGEKATALQLIREASGDPRGRATIRTLFGLDSRMAPWRKDPEILALFAGGQP